MVLKFKNLIRFIFLFVIISGACFSYASTTNGTIDNSNHSALLCKNDACTVTSSINFLTTNGAAVHITDTAVTGNAWSEDMGWINLNPTNGGVTNTSAGILGGYAWGEVAGWINFKPTTGGVTINNAGQFVGFAWTQNYGWIKFNCGTSGACLETDWRKASVRSSGGSSGSGGGTTTPPTDPVVPPTDPVIPPTDPVIPPTDPVIPPTDPVIPPTDPVIPPTDPVIPDDPGTGGETDPLPTPPETAIDAIKDIIDTIFNPGNGGSDTGDINNPGIVTDIATSISDIFNSPKAEEIKNYIEDKKAAVSEAVNTPTGDATSKATTAAGVASGIYLSTTTALFVNPLAFADIFLIPLRLWGLLMVALGIRKRNLPWGTVYDSITKQPLDPAYVVLKDMNGNEVATSITDLDGRYGFLVPAGRYVMSAGKTNYSFPSKKLFGKTNDELYQDLYFSEVIELKEGGVISKNIPMDPIKFDWNEFAKKDKKLMKFFSKRDIWISRIINLFFYLGFIITVVVLFASYSTYNLVIFCIYILMFVLKNTILKPRSYGRIKEKETDAPSSFAIMRVFANGTEREIVHKVADKTGKYFCLVPNGLYYTKIENKNDDESYSPALISPPIEVKNGYINKKFEI